MQNKWEIKIKSRNNSTNWIQNSVLFRHTTVTMRINTIKYFDNSNLYRIWNEELIFFLRIGWILLFEYHTIFYNNFAIFFFLLRFVWKCMLFWPVLLLFCSSSFCYCSRFRCVCTNVITYVNVLEQNDSWFDVFVFSFRFLVLNGHRTSHILLFTNWKLWFLSAKMAKYGLSNDNLWPHNWTI